MKYIWKFLMGHRKFLWTFLIFLVTSFEKLWVSEQKMFKLVICCNLRHYDGAKDIYLFDKFFWGFYICLTPCFQKYFRLTSCIIFMKELISLTTVTMEISKRQFLSYHSNGYYEEKKLYQKLEFCRFELPLQKLVWLSQCRLR